jgi:hypothetical protein
MYPTSDPIKSDASLKIVGSNTFGRFAKISAEQTFNMMVSDDWLVPTPGYKKSLEIQPGSNGRAIYASARGGFMIVVLANVVYRVEGAVGFLNYRELFRLNTAAGDVSIDENIASQIAICDGQNLWIYNWALSSITEAVLPINPATGLTILPGYVTYHDGYFIVPDTTSARWYLSALNDGTIWNWGAGGTYVFGSIQTKPTNGKAVLRAPGKGNLIYVFGSTVTELWNNYGAQLFPYQRNNGVSIDYGCISSSTIGAMDEYVAWLGANEKSGPIIMISRGGSFEHLSTDGIDFKLADLIHPEQSYGFFYKIDGHVFYQLTFYAPEDNYTLVYDFNTKKFFYLTDENMNFHIANSVAFYNDTYYFTDLRNDGAIYEMNSHFTQYDYTIPPITSFNQNVFGVYQIPRVRICNNFRQLDTSRFVAASLTFTIEQGTDPFYQQSEIFYLTTEDGFVISEETPTGFVGIFLQTEQVLADYAPRVDMSISKDGGQTFGNFISRPMNLLGDRKNRMIFWRLGAVNDLVVQFRFWSKSRVVVSDGVFQARPIEGGQ